MVDETWTVNLRLIQHQLKEAQKAAQLEENKQRSVALKTIEPLRSIGDFMEIINKITCVSVFILKEREGNTRTKSGPFIQAIVVFLC